MERCYSIAGIRFQVRCPEKWMYREDGVLTGFRCDLTDPGHILEFAVVRELAPPEGMLVFSQPDKQVYRDGAAQIRYDGAVSESLTGAYMRICREGTYSRIQVREDAIRGHITPKLVLNALEAEHRLVEAGAFLLHASYICCQGKAILFTAPSGTGKSTQADLWCRLRGARLINGDRAAVSADPSGITVHGIPFAGSSGVFENESYPLSAIVYLSQAPQTTLAPLTGVRAFRAVWEGCSVNVWNPEDISVCTETVLETVQRVPVYHLACTPDESAVKALEQELTARR